MATQESFEQFVRTHATNLLRTCFLLVGERAGAEDLLQDALTRLYPNWHRVEAADAPVSYVRRAIMNEYLNSRRRSQVRFLDLGSGDFLDRVPDAEPHFADRFLDRDQALRLLCLLNERQRAAVVLRYFDGLEDTDIALHLDCRRGTVRSLISRGIATMRAASARPSSDERSA